MRTYLIWFANITFVIVCIMCICTKLTLCRHVARICCMFKFLTFIELCFKLCANKFDYFAHCCYYNHVFFNNLFQIILCWQRNFDERTIFFIWFCCFVNYIDSRTNLIEFQCLISFCSYCILFIVLNPSISMSCTITSCYFSSIF